MAHNLGGDDCQDIVQLFKSLTSNENRRVRVKICVSSRPWQVFTDAFITGPSLRLQDLTEPDIRKYLMDSLSESRPLLSLLTNESSDLNSLAELLMIQANGVFLWANLVTKKVLRDARDGAEMAEIHARILAMPQGLEELFVRMLQDIPEDYVDEAARIFQIRRCSMSPPSLLDVHFACLDVSEAITAPMKVLELDQQRQIRERMERRIKSRCGGLLETRWISSSPARTEVQYSHQSVKELLETKDVVAWLAGHIKNPHFNANAQLLASCIWKVKSFHFAPKPHVGGEAFWQTSADADTSPRPPGRAFSRKRACRYALVAKN